MVFKNVKKWCMLKGFDNVKREIKLFDMRNFEKTINTVINSSSGVIFPFYKNSHCIFIPML